jgi:uncharacterized protein Smg (DUF494 family)
MVTPEVLAYARTQQSAGVKKEDLTKNLLGVGWDAQSIEEIFRTLEKETPVVAASTSTPAATMQPSVAKTPEIKVDPVQTQTTPAEASRARITITPTLRALTAIDSQLRAGVDKKTVQALLLGVGWDMPAIEEAFLAVDWGESLLRPNATTEAPSLDTRAPKLKVVDDALAHSSPMPNRRALIAIDALLHDGASKGNIRTLLMGVGWDIRSIDEAFLAVEWRDDPTSATISTTTSLQPQSLNPKPELSVTPMVQQKPVTQKTEEPVLHIPHEEASIVTPQQKPAVLPVGQTVAPKLDSVMPATPMTEEPAKMKGGFLGKILGGL